MQRDRRRVLVTGARGQLAGAIIDTFSVDADVLAYSREDLDITNADAVLSRMRADRPDVIVNCAAYNEVDAAEDQPEKALLVNAFAVRLLASAATEAGSTLVHYSTDFVFDGETSRPYTEEDPPNPRSVYAQSKLLGEWFALGAPRRTRAPRRESVWREGSQELHRSHHPINFQRYGRQGVHRSNGVAQLCR